MINENEKPTKYPPLPLEAVTNSDKYHRYSLVESKEEGQAFRSMCVNHTMGFAGVTREYAEGLEDRNIAFYIWFMLTHGSYSEKEFIRTRLICIWIGCVDEFDQLFLKERM